MLRYIPSDIIEDIVQATIPAFPGFFESSKHVRVNEGVR